MSLYRKYRPRTFPEVIGQDHIVTTLENAVQKDRLTHAYLFSGPRGTGKTSVARILAKAMLTRGIEDDSLVKHIFKSVDDGSLVDLMEIDAASHTQVDNIRDLIEKIQFSPVIANAKVYIVDEVHMLSKSAFNALLKTLEEPPDYAFFILATTELQKIPLTIQSRCQRYPFREIHEEDIVRHLQRIVDEEHISIDRPALRAIAHHVQGGMRDAIALLDQLRSLEHITLDDVRKRTGETGQEYIEDVLDATRTNDTNRILSIVAKMEDEAVPLDSFLRQLLTAIRGKLHEAVREKQDIGHYVHLLDIILEAIRDIRMAPVPGLVLEATLLSLCKPDSRHQIPDSRKTSGSKTQEKPAEKTQTIQPSGHQIKTPESPKAAEAPDLTLDSLKASWPEILKQVTPPSVRMSLKTCQVVSADDSKVTLFFPSAFHRDNVADTEASRVVEGVIENMFKKNMRLQCTLEEDKAHVPEEDIVDLAEAAKEVF